VLAWPTTALVRARTSIGPEIEGSGALREVLGDARAIPTLADHWTIRRDNVGRLR
jgi:hypothetical protein